MPPAQGNLGYGDKGLQEGEASQSVMRVGAGGRRRPGGGPGPSLAPLLPLPGLLTGSQLGAGVPFPSARLQAWTTAAPTVLSPLQLVLPQMLHVEPATKVLFVGLCT